MDNGHCFSASGTTRRELSPTVFLMSPSPLQRAGLKLLLEKSGFCVIGEAGTLDPIDSGSHVGMAPQLILIEFPPTTDIATGSTCLKALRQRFTAARIVLFDGVFRPEWLSICNEISLDGYLLKDREWPIVDRQLRLIYSGIRLVTADFLTHVVTSGAHSLEHQMLPAVASPLSPIDIEMLRCLSGGLSDQIIAQRLNVRVSVAKARMRSLRRKCGASNRTETAIWAHEHGIVAGG